MSSNDLPASHYTFFFFKCRIVIPSLFCFLFVHIISAHLNLSSLSLSLSLPIPNASLASLSPVGSLYRRYFITYSYYCYGCTHLYTHRSQMMSSQGSVGMAVPCLNENRRLFPSSRSHDPWTLDLGSPTWPHLYCQTLDILILYYKQAARAVNISQMSVSGLRSAFIFLGFKLRAVWPLKWKLIGWKSNLRLGRCRGSHRNNPDSEHIKD